MGIIRIGIGENEVLITEGLKAIVAPLPDVEVVLQSETGQDLREALNKKMVDLIVIDYSAPGFSIDDIDAIYRKWPDAKILAITSDPDTVDLQRALRTGLNGHILKCCDQGEITTAIYSIVEGDKFFCGKVLNALDEDSDATPSCAPINLSPRELDIIRLVAEGNTNKEIAEKLFLSAHTVMTHRKNIMAKLGINNTAGIVMYAVKEKIISPNKFLFANSEQG